jgi:DNA repair protein RecN (Recombination protein N)
MIKSLYIKNYALIKEVFINFENGFTSVTGETGAGKSIFVGALSLILGNRADSSLLLDKDFKCIVEGEFEADRYDLKSFFILNDLDYNSIAVLRREISSNGRSRSFINDTPVNLNQLKELGNRLFDIHSQNQNQKINDKKYQLQILDTYSLNNKKLNDYQDSYSLYLKQNKYLESLKNKAVNDKSDADYKQFLLDEIQKVKLNDNNELDQLENELKVLDNSERISLQIRESIQLSDESEMSIINQLSNLNSNLQSISPFSNDIKSIYERVNSLLLELKDCVLDLNLIESKIIHDPQRLDQIREKFDLINNLLRKHSVPDVKSLIELKEQISNDLNEVNNIDNIISDQEIELKILYDKCFCLAKEISNSRKTSVSKFQNEIQSVLSQLGMKDAILSIELTKSKDLNEFGIDDVSFLFSANKGVELSQLEKVASGGELSRLMFSIKSCIANKMNLPTILFDEIDTGVSGEIAHKMGQLMQKMTTESSMQVISITHLPQVAARGLNQMYVEKKIENNVSFTHLRILNKNERLKEIAKMLSGKEITEVSLSNARELLATK